MGAVQTGPGIGWPQAATLPRLAADAAEQAADRPALIDAVTDTVVTFGSLQTGALGLAGALAEKHFGKGDILFTIMPNCLDWYVAALAAQMLGGAISSINPMAPAGEIARQFGRINAKAVLTIPELLTAASEVAGDTAVLSTADLRSLGNTDIALHRRSHSTAEAAAFLPFSSGTTGLPKPVILTHQNMIAAAASVASAVALDTGDRMLGLAPVFHVVGPLIFAMALLKRASIVVLPRLESALLVNAIERHGVTHCPVVPPMLRLLACHPAGEGRRYSSLKAVFCGGNFLDPGLQEIAIRRLGCPVVQVFATTEAAGIISIDSLSSPRPGSAGFAAPLVSMRIADPATGEILEPGRDGELQCKGANIFAGYLGLPSDTANAKTPDGWLRSGDLAKIDQSGRLWIKGRYKELVKVHAGQVPPAELEALLLAHPNISDAAVIGRANAHCGQIPIASVVWRESVDPFAVMEWLNDQVLGYKRIRAIEPIDVIPRNASGKIDRAALLA